MGKENEAVLDITNTIHWSDQFSLVADGSTVMARRRYQYASVDCSHFGARMNSVIITTKAHKDV
jgi:hypothetical protein